VSSSSVAQDGQTRPRGRVLLAQLAKPLRAFMATEAGSAGLLLTVTVLALIWANSPLSESYESLWSTELAIRIGDALLAMDLGHWVNDGLMALFFFVIGLEVRRELSMGELTDRRRLTVPALAALGGLVVPALLYLAVNPSGEAANGWGVVIGTDTAFLLGALALVGPACPTQLRVFLLTPPIPSEVVLPLAGFLVGRGDFAFWGRSSPRRPGRRSGRSSCTAWTGGAAGRWCCVTAGGCG
jgi:Na+/H+ antiporter NhaA